MFHNKEKKKSINEKPFQQIPTNTDQFNNRQNSPNYYANIHKQDNKQKITDNWNSIVETVNALFTCLSQNPNKQQNTKQININKFPYPATHNFNLHNENKSYQRNNSTNQNSFRKKTPHTNVDSKHEILNYSHLYGKVHKKQYDGKILIKITLYPQLQRNLTDYEIKNGKKYMFRCPLQSCKHEPLNYDDILTDLNKHFQMFHSHDKDRKYIVRFRKNEKWTKLCFSKT